MHVPLPFSFSMDILDILDICPFCPPPTAKATHGQDMDTTL